MAYEKDVNDYYLKGLATSNNKTIMLVKPRTNLKTGIYSEEQMRNKEPSTTYVTNYIFDKGNKVKRCSSYRDTDKILKNFDLI